MPTTTHAKVTLLHVRLKVIQNCTSMTYNPTEIRFKRPYVTILCMLVYVGSHAHIYAHVDDMSESAN